MSESEPETLIVALEPEAASVWCKQLPKAGFMAGDLTAAETIRHVALLLCTIQPISGRSTRELTSASRR